MVSLVVYSFLRLTCIVSGNMGFLGGYTGFLGVILVSWMLLSVFWVLAWISGACVGCLGGYLISSVVTWGFLSGHMDFSEFILVSSVLYGFPGWFYGSLFIQISLF